MRVFNFWRDHASNLRGIQEQLVSAHSYELSPIKRGYNTLTTTLKSLIDREIYLVDCFNDVLSLIEPKCDACSLWLLTSRRRVHAVNHRYRE